MIFKSLCLQEPLLKSQEFVTCYAGRGLRSGVAVRGFVKGPAAVAVGRIAPTGRTAPKAPAGQSWPDDELFPWLTTPIRHWPKLKNTAWYCGKLRCLSKTWLHLRDKSTRILWDIHVVWTRALWFSTLLATAVPYYILTIRKLANLTNVKRQVQKGVLAWAFGRSIHIIYWHTINYRQKNKTNKCQEGRKLFTSSKT